MSDLLIRSGRILDPASGRDEVADLLVEDGHVVAVEANISGVAVKHELDAEGCLVTPGLVDPHVHLREPGQEGKETIATGTASAAAGGFTTVCCMPNTAPALDDPQVLEFIRLKAQETGSARVHAVAAATIGRKGEEIAPIGALTRSGAVGFSDDGDVIADAAMMRMVMRTCKTHDRVFMQHAQELTLTRGAAMNEGPTATRLGLGGWPALAEELIVERDIRIAAETGCRYHVQHVSSAGTVELIRAARQAGLPVSGEASPHHLLLTDEACDGYDTNAKMNPPLRSWSDVEALRAGVADGAINVLATDHAPHTEADKNTDFASAAFGIVGLDCALPLYEKALVSTGLIDWPRLIALLTIEPARLVGLDRQGVGKLEVGGVADITIIDPERTWSIDPDRFMSKGRNCPFKGWEVRSRAIATILGGDIVHQANDALVEA
ncbi:MAG: dihydroorotase [Phycisphaerales bacterium]|nr:dihydroorotase [Phycisphaerales bacterium]